MKPKHKKFFYKAFAYVGMKSFNGSDAIPIDLPVEFMSEGGCEAFIAENALNAEWPAGYPVPEVIGACDPICFCAIYRRQIAREWRKRPSRAVILIFAGYERMRRSVAEESILAKGGIVTDDVPDGYYFKAVWSFLRTLF